MEAVSQGKVKEDKMGNTRKAWIQIPDYTSYDIGEVSREEIERLWGSRWAQKCIRDVAEEVAVARFSPYPRKKTEEFCSPQLAFENDKATLAVSPFLDIKPAILYGLPLEDFSSWTVFLNVRSGRKLFGIIPLDYCFEIVVSQEEALELVKLFYDNGPEKIVPLAKQWKEQIGERYRYRLVGAFFL